MKIPELTFFVLCFLPIIVIAVIKFSITGLIVKINDIENFDFLTLCCNSFMSSFWSTYFLFYSCVLKIILYNLFMDFKMKPKRKVGVINSSHKDFDYLFSLFSRPKMSPSEPSTYVFKFIDFKNIYIHSFALGVLGLKTVHSCWNLRV